jgi:hypothetical protein
MTTWQHQTLAQLTDFLQSFDALQAVLVVGSLANDDVQLDFWSDIDLVIMVSDESIDRFYPGSDWLKPIQPVFATSHSEDPPRYTLRVCFNDMRRVDFIFILASALDDPDCIQFHRFQGGYRLLFSRLPELEGALSKEPPLIATERDPDAQFLAVSNDFWFKSTLAVTKVVRNDLLIALHLALDLMRDCLVLRMMLRDRAEGTCHHRTGGDGNELVAQMNAQLSNFSTAGILTMIEAASQKYEELAKEWSPGYEAKRGPLSGLIRQAHEHLSHQQSLTQTEIRS